MFQNKQENHIYKGALQTKMYVDFKAQHAGIHLSRGFSI